LTAPCVSRNAHGKLFKDVPEVFASDIALNEACDTSRDDFNLAEVTEHEPPSAEEVAENKAKHGL